ncbi:MAG TPA: hypothetical protein PKL31_10695 [Fulvivirga sp.]|nr:hypothetical protein [Fulvivirga sp.]
MKINVPEKYADLYIKALMERKELLLKKIEDFRNEMLEIDNHISNLTSLPIFNDSGSDHQNWNINSYSKSWPWTKKIAYLQGFRMKLVTSQEAVDFIMKNEKELDKSKVRSSVSAALSNGLRSGKFTKFIDPTGTATYYGPSEWFNGDGQPQLNFIPDELKKRLFNKAQ